MFYQNKDQLEQKIQKHHLAIKELSINIENLNRQTHELLSELNVNSEQISSFLNNKDNFTEEDWHHLQKQQKELNHKLESALNNIKDPRKAKEAQLALNPQKHWLFVR